MSFTSLHRIMQKGMNSFSHSSNGINGKRHNMGDSSVDFTIYFPNGDSFEEKLYMKEPLAQQLTRIINELRRRGSMFMKKKYYYHALHPVDLLIIDEDHKFIPNDRPPGNWPTVVKSIMQERKPLLYIWSFKFSEKDKVSFPDVAHMTEPKFFGKKPNQVDQSEPSLNLHEVRRCNSVCAFSPQKIPIQFEDSQSLPKAKPRVQNNSTLINSHSQLRNDNITPPPIPPKTKCSSMTCIDEHVVNSHVTDRTFERHFSNNGTGSLAPKMSQLYISNRNPMPPRAQPLLPPSERLPLNMNGSRTPDFAHPVPPMRNSSNRKSQQVNSFILPTGDDGYFSDLPFNTAKLLNRDFPCYNNDLGSSCNTTPPSPLPAHHSPLLPLVRQNTVPDLPHPPPIQSYKFKRDQSMQAFAAPKMLNKTLSSWDLNKNGYDEEESFYSPILPTVPPKCRNLVNSKLPVAMPRRRKPEESSKHNLTHNVPSPSRVPLRSYNKMPPLIPRNGDSIGYPANEHMLNPLPLPQKKRTNGTTSLMQPMIPSRMKTAPSYPVRY